MFQRLCPVSKIHSRGIRIHERFSNVRSSAHALPVRFANLRNNLTDLLRTVAKAIHDAAGLLRNLMRVQIRDQGIGLAGRMAEVGCRLLRVLHGFLDLARSNARPKVGEVVRVVPNHVCVVVNMVDRLIAVRGDKIVDLLPVAARGRLA